MTSLNCSFMSWWQRDKCSNVGAHQHFSRQPITKRKCKRREHQVPCCLPPNGNQMSRGQYRNLSPGNTATYKREWDSSHVWNRIRPGREPDVIQIMKDTWLETDIESSRGKAPSLQLCAPGAEKDKAAWKGSDLCISQVPQLSQPPCVKEKLKDESTKKAKRSWLVMLGRKTSLQNSLSL